LIERPSLTDRWRSATQQDDISILLQGISV
jgi:hypothetical protein